MSCVGRAEPLSYPGSGPRAEGPSPTGPWPPGPSLMVTHRTLLIPPWSPAQVLVTIRDDPEHTLTGARDRPGPLPRCPTPTQGASWNGTRKNRCVPHDVVHTRKRCSGSGGNSRGAQPAHKNGPEQTPRRGRDRAGTPPRDRPHHRPTSLHG